MRLFFNRLAKTRRAPRSGALCEPLEDRRLLSAAGHSTGLRIHRAGHLTVVQEQPSSLIIATVTGTDTSSAPAGQVAFGNDSVGMHAIVQWGSGKSAVRQEASVYTTAQPNVLDVRASNPLPPGDYPVRIRMTNNGKLVGVVNETVHVQKTTSNGLALHAIAGQPITATLGYLQNIPPAGQELVVNWGDQASAASSPQLVATSSGSYAVNAAHTYEKPGKYVISVFRESPGFESSTIYFPYDIISTITVSRT